MIQVCDLQPKLFEAQQRNYPDVTFTSRYEDLLEHEEIDVIGFQPLQAVFHGLHKVAASGAAGVQVFAGREICVCGDDKFVAAAGDENAQNLLRPPVAVDIGAIPRSYRFSMLLMSLPIAPNSVRR